MAADGLLPIRLHHHSTSEKFKSRIRVVSNLSVTTAGTEEITVSIPDPFQLPVEIEITVLEPDKKTPMEILRQVFEVTRDSAGTRALVPTNCSTVYNGRKIVAHWRHRLHPRLSIAGQSAHEFQTLVADFTFVHATEYFSKDSEFKKAYNTGVGRNPHAGCTLQVLEFTLKQGPPTWLVIVPPALNTASYNSMRPEGWRQGESKQRAAQSFDMLLYLRPRVAKNDQLVFYDAIENTPAVGLMSRFFAEPDPKGPFFASTAGAWETGPSVGFEQQLIDSGKNVLVIHPWPSGLAIEYLYAERLRLVANAVLKSLYSNGAIGNGNVFGVSPARLGVAGFSGGGNEAIKVWKANRHAIDELYLFDPQDFGKDQRKTGQTLLVNENGLIIPELREWFGDERRSPSPPGRRLRLVGGLQHEMALSIANQLDPNWKKKLVLRESSTAPAPRVWCKPVETKFRIGLADDIIYSWAFIAPPADGKFTREALAQHRLSRTGDPASQLTTETGLELVDEGKPNEITFRVIEMKRNFKAPVSHAEFAGFLRSVWVRGNKWKSPLEDDLWKTRDKNQTALVKDEATLKSLQKLAAFYLLHGRDRKSFDKDKLPIIHRAHGVRHQWTPCGGERDPSRGAKFEGYFYLCLRDSAFRN